MTDLVAAVDCGTNSVRLYVARVAGGEVEAVDRRLFITRLGQGVDATGRFAEAALERTFAAFDDFAAELRELGGAKVRVVATSAARDASNSAEFFDGVMARMGVPAEIISGREEATLSYEGAVSASPGAARPVLVMDVGGGSTELAFGGDELRQAVSLNMGSVRLRERFFAADPPTPDEIAAAEAFVGSLLDGSGVPFADVATWIGVGGTATALAAIVLGLSRYDSKAVHGSLIARPDLGALTDRLLAMPVAEIAALPTMVPGRADVICAGALICRAVGRRVGHDLRASEADLLDGIVARLAT